MSRVKNNIKGKNILSIYTGHDSSAAFIDKNNKLKVLEYERFIKQRYGAFTKHLEHRNGIGTTEEQRRLFLQYIKDNALGEIKVIITDDPQCNDIDLILEYFPDCKLEIVLHHDAHAASAFYTSELDEAVILSFDGGGVDIHPHGKVMPNKYGLFNTYSLKPKYQHDSDSGSSCFQPPQGTYFANTMARGYYVKDNTFSFFNLGYNSPNYNQPVQFNLGETYSMISKPIQEIKPGQDFENESTNSLAYAGKIMGLCGYGNIRKDWEKDIKEYYLTAVDPDESVQDLGKRINLDLGFNNLSGQDAYDLAATSQHHFELISCKIVDHLLKIKNVKNVILVGGCALNVLFNQKLAEHLKERDINVYVPPYPNDCGLALGQFLFYAKSKVKLSPYCGFDILDRDKFDSYKKEYKAVKCDTKDLVDLIKRGKIIGILQGESEIGPRALGNRSIICDPSIKDMKDILNSKVKFREWYRPFAPVCRLEDSESYFDNVFESKYMSYAPTVKEKYRKILPSITHVDGTARLQTVTKDDHKLFYDILTELKNRDEIPVILNTSFNMKGYPILTTIEDALTVLEETEMDHVYIEGYLFTKK